jgi:hypothetical protein
MPTGEKGLDDVGPSSAKEWLKTPNAPGDATSFWAIYRGRLQPDPPQNKTSGGCQGSLRAKSTGRIATESRGFHADAVVCAVDDRTAKSDKPVDEFSHVCQ